jgi:hypothetical protein
MENYILRHLFSHKADKVKKTELARDMYNLVNEELSEIQPREMVIKAAAAISDSHKAAVVVKVDTEADI